MSELIEDPRTPGSTASPPERPGWTRARAIVGSIVLVAVSLFALITVVIPLLLGAQTYTVLTASMQPGMPPGTLIAVRPSSIDDVRVGDVVTYQLRSGEPAVVTHRVVGTTSSTGGARLLITRGDANDADDPPVQSEQLRGTVVFAVPYLGYPGVVFGGQERGIVIAAVGVAVVGYGLVLLIFDLVRSHRHRRATTAFTLILVMASVPLLMPTPASASSTRLLVSDDGARFVSDGAVRLFDQPDRIVPGGTLTSTLWIRNASPDPARAGLRLDTAPVDTDPVDTSFARSLTLIVASTPVPQGDQWVSSVIAPGDTLRVDLGVRMDAASGNISRNADAVVTPVVQLTDATGTDPVIGEPGPTLAAPSRTGGALAWTGIRSTPWGMLVAGAAAVVTLGLALGLRRDQGR
ncbi:signal peptidase I [Microbacterium sp. AG157]|uniref:signal peptidase I n=1 Tax=Microbacterium sp. AG157 TaxID=2183993 RepID=UPI000E24B7C0|nr:signal peptidase I [Microbacterium sp. AG157]REC97123.1 signal peptidase I [Microbacterium sp. AG157]